MRTDMISYFKTVTDSVRWYIDIYFLAYSKNSKRISSIISILLHMCSIVASYSIVIVCCRYYVRVCNTAGLHRHEVANKGVRFSLDERVRERTSIQSYVLTHSRPLAFILSFEWALFGSFRKLPLFMHNQSRLRCLGRTKMKLLQSGAI